MDNKPILTLIYHEQFQSDEDYVRFIMSEDDVNEETARQYEIDDFEAQVRDACKDINSEVSQWRHNGMAVETDWNTSRSELEVNFRPIGEWRNTSGMLLGDVLSVMMEYPMRPIGYDGEVIDDYDDAVKFVTDTLQ